MNINEIFDYIATTDLHENILIEDKREVDWEVYPDEVLWVEDGDSYSAEIYHGGIVGLGNLIFINADNGCGCKYTYIFDIGNQMLRGDGHE